MSALGNTAQQQVFQPAIDYFSGTGSTAQFTLSRPVASVAQMIVSVANVIQNPNTFSVNNNILTLGGNAPVGTNNVWVQYQTSIVQVNQPGQGTVGTNQLMDAGVTALKIAGSTITPDKLSTGAPSWDSSGRVTMPYQPAFRAQKTDAVQYTTSTSDIAFNAIQFNIGSHYNSSTGVFTAPIAGLYMFSFRGFAEVAGRISIDLRVNGGTHISSYGPQEQGDNAPLFVIVNLAANDSVACRLRIGTLYAGGGGDTAQFMGYLLG